MRKLSATEIERKFVVITSKLPDLANYEWQSLRQGYLHVPLSAKVRKNGKGGFYIAFSKKTSYRVDVPAADVPGIMLAIQQRKKNPSVRIRLSKTEKGKQAWITLKGRSAIQMSKKKDKPEAGGFGKAEFEYEIEFDDAKDLFKRCDHKLSKVRYHVPYKGQLWDLDEYTGDHDSLWTAEIELKDEHDQVEIPPWCGEEVTGHPSMTNHNLAKEEKIPKDVRKIQKRLVALTLMLRR